MSRNAISFDFGDLLTDKVTIVTSAASDAYGRRTGAVATTYPARVQRGRKQQRTVTGRDVIVDGHVYIAGNPAVRPDDKMTLTPGEVVNVVEVEDFHDEVGPHHVKIAFGRA